MEKYEPLGVVGEGSYGIVLKCRNRADNKIVAIKKFIDSEDDVNVRKIALREIRVLKKLRHENLVNLLEVFRRRKHLYLVFEFIDHTLLEQLEQTSHGLDEETCRKYIFQILRGLGFCHDNNVIHRDVKPENVLVSTNGIVKLCDFGFARNLCGPGDIYTDYVATRWYRAPELLVGDAAYGKEVDIWAVGCLFAEMSTGEPLFPGDSDIDQLFLIAQCLGRLSKRHLNIMSKNSAFRGFQFPKSRHGSTTSTSSSKGIMKVAGPARNSGSTFSSHMQNVNSSGKRRQSPYGYDLQHESASGIFSSMFPSWTEDAVYFLTVCLDPEPTSRPTCNSLIRMPYFTHDNFPIKFLSELSNKLQLEGRPPLTTSSVQRKRRNVVGGANVSPALRAGNFASTSTSSHRNFFGPSHGVGGGGGSTEEIHKQHFQSNNLGNQAHFSTSTNLSRQHTFVVGPKDQKANVFGKNETSHSRIPVSLGRKSSEEAINGKITSNISTEDHSSHPHHPPTLISKEKRFSTSQTPKKYSFSSGNAGEESGNVQKEHTTHPLPITTLTFNIGPHNMSYNGTYLSTTVPAAVRAKSPSFPSTSTNFPLGNQNFRRSSPARIRKKVPLAPGGGLGQAGSNPKSLPIGVSVLGSSLSLAKGTNGEQSFLPRVTPKNGISLNPPGSDENNPFQNFGNANQSNNYGKKREKLEQLQNVSQSRRSSFSTDFGNIKPFLTAAVDRESSPPSKPTMTSGFPFM